MEERIYRYLILCSLICWLLNSIFNFYLIAFLADALSTISILIAITRFAILAKKQKNSQQVVENNTETTNN